MANRLAALLLIATLTGCSSLPLGFLGGGGTNVAANTQVGKENRQAIASFESGDVVRKDVEAGQVETVTINNGEIPPWVLLVALLGWLLPSPGEMGRGIYRLLKGDK